MRHQRNLDPYWTTARFNSTCRCGKAIKRGDRIFYRPNGKVAYCEECGQSEQCQFQAEVWDEEHNTCL